MGEEAVLLFGRVFFKVCCRRFSLRVSFGPGTHLAGP